MLELNYFRSRNLSIEDIKNLNRLVFTVKQILVTHPKLKAELDELAENRMFGSEIN